MSFAQIDRAIDHREVQTVKKLTDIGSKEFLQGAAAVSSAMVRLDEERFEEAHHEGLNTAPQFFSESSKKFSEAAQIIRNIEDLRNAFAEYLRALDYAERALKLRVLDSTAAEAAWKFVQNLALREGADGLLAVAARYAQMNEELSRSFFASIRHDGYSPMEGAQLLAKIGRDLLFGAFVSALFAKQET